MAGLIYGKDGGCDFKCGVVSSISDGATSVVTFGTAFLATPVVALTQASGAKEHCLTATSVSTTGFTITVIKTHTGGSDSIDVYWQASDAGDP